MEKLNYIQTIMQVLWFTVVLITTVVWLFGSIVLLCGACEEEKPRWAGGAVLSLILCVSTIWYCYIHNVPVFFIFDFIKYIFK